MATRGAGVSIAVMLYCEGVWPGVSAAIGIDGSVKGVLTQCVDFNRRPYDPAVGAQKDFTLTSYIDVMWVRKFLTSKWKLQLPTCD